MDHYQSKLLGELIGLARATDGNEHLITQDSTSVILMCLQARPANEAEFQQILNQIHSVKRQMVPDCYLCANPCGKNFPFDLSRIQLETPKIQAAKHKILMALLDADAATNEASLYRGLIALGIEGSSEEFLYSVAQEIRG